MTQSQTPDAGPPVRHFTAEQADRMLPLVGRIVTDVVAGYRRWQDLVSAFELAAVRSTADHPDPDAVLLQREAQLAAAEIEGFLAELDALGVQCKSPDVGLVDFPTEHEGRTVYLCWRLGEPSVQYWHEIDAGYAGRRPLTLLAAR